MKKEKLSAYLQNFSAFTKKIKSGKEGFEVGKGFYQKMIPRERRKRKFLSRQRSAQNPICQEGWTFCPMHLIISSAPETMDSISS
jgi:hypothetical protein